MRRRTSITPLITYLSYIAFILAVSSDRLHFLDISRILWCIRSLYEIWGAFNMTSILSLELAISFRAPCLRKAIWVIVKSSVLIGTVWMIRSVFLVLVLSCFKKLTLFLYNLNSFSSLLRGMGIYCLLDMTVNLLLGK